VVLYVIIGVVLVCGLCACAATGAYFLLSPNVPSMQQGSEDDQIIAGVEDIARGCEQFAGGNGFGPSVDDVSPEGAVASYMDAWPTNPLTGQPMRQGNQPGDFVFHTATSMCDGEEYLGYIDAVLSDGSTYSVEFEY
jgi:hypothetical protein